MLVLPQQKAIALKLRNPEKVTSLIEEARVFEWKGVPVTLVPHRPETTLILRNLGFDAPSPIHSRYQWSGRYTPFHAQSQTVDIKTVHPRMYNCSDMGTGKTLSTLWSYDYLRSIGRVKRALIVCPLSTLSVTWGEHIFEHFPNLNYAVLHGSREKRLKLLANKEFDIYLINPAGLDAIVDDLEHRGDIDLIVLDELTDYKNPSTDRWKLANEICNKQKLPDGSDRRVWGLTGTPTPNKPTDAYGQIKLVTPWAVKGIGSGRFKEMVMLQMTEFLWIPKKDAQETIAKFMQPAVRFAMEDCVELPDLIHIEREATMSREQAAAYKSMMDMLVAEVANGEVLAVNEGVKAGKLIQIAAGCAYGPNGEELLLGAPSRIAVVKEIMEQSASGKSIVFVPYVSLVKYVAGELTKAGYKVEYIFSETTKKERDRIFRAMQAGELDAIVAIPSCMSHGITLTAASTIIWYAPIPDNGVFSQANARCHRPGQKHKSVVAMIWGSPIERRYYRRLKDRENSQGILLDLLKRK